MIRAATLSNCDAANKNGSHFMGRVNRENGEATRGPRDSPRLTAAARRQTHDHSRARFARAPRLRILSLMSDVQLSTAPYRAGAWNAAAESPACFVK